MLGRSNHRASRGISASSSGPCPRRIGTGTLLIVLIALSSMMGLVSCIAWGLRPESALMMASPDDVWEAALDLLRDGEYKIENQDNSTRELRATKDIVIRMQSDRATPTTAQKIHHQVDLSVKAGGDNRSIVEVTYVIDKILEEEQAFRLLQALRDRLRMSEGSTARPRSPR